MDVKILLLLICFSLVTKAQTTVGTVFGDGMVLQQQKDIYLLGTDNVGTKIIVVSSWGETTKTTTSKNGKWKLRLSTPLAGGPH